MTVKPARARHTNTNSCETIERNEASEFFQQPAGLQPCAGLIMECSLHYDIYALDPVVAVAPEVPLLI